MATSLKNLSEYSSKNVGDVSKKCFGIAVAEWNNEITEALLQGAYSTLQKHGAKTENIIVRSVAGSFELPLASQWLAQREDIDAVIAIGCIIQGETRHFDFIAQAVANGIMQVGLKYNKPVIFGVLTTNNLEQARERAGGKHGNKGDEAAITAIKMLFWDNE
ncbi:MAG: 6,7-dimethyl-8-ribityllumazine synthase [Raineya sp.]|nr:6,7-dimethyl-8-ribityllumazine synthase [Raineya sp.]MDW8296019.1 6,7-dimethyl-8-ribityllumazine synthase [Raineya sp.]